jgi:hypothetical protein
MCGLLRSWQDGAAVLSRTLLCGPGTLTRVRSMQVFVVLGLCVLDRVVMILPQVHLRKPCYDFTFL